MKKSLGIFLSSLLSGFCITIGASIYLVALSKGAQITGAFLFGIGLFTIIHFGLWLYTGKVGHTLDNKPKYILDLIICLVGNLIGVILLALVIKYTRTGEVLINASKPIVEAKQNDSWYSILLLSMLCGFMIYIACVGHKKCEYPIGKALFAFLPIVGFILCGFEHVVANACYYTYAGVFNGKVVLNFFIMAIGNGFGAIMLDGLFKLTNHLNKE